MIARAQRRHQRDDDRGQARRDQRRSRRAGYRGPGFAQRLGGRRAVRAVDVTLLAALQRRHVGKKHGRAAKGRKIDEPLRRFGVAAEMHEARSAAQSLLGFVGELFHRSGFSAFGEEQDEKRARRRQPASRASDSVQAPGVTCPSATARR
jgi:hypothetical protein